MRERLKNTASYPLPICIRCRVSPGLKHCRKSRLEPGVDAAVLIYMFLLVRATGLVSLANGTYTYENSILLACIAARVVAHSKLEWPLPTVSFLPSFHTVRKVPLVQCP